MRKVDEYGRSECVVVFTCRGKDRILREGGSQAWRINKSRASKCRYVICVQNRNETWGQATANHKEAFLIGKISSIESSREKGSTDRAIIQISAYAEISVPDSWDGNRNPVAYRHLSDFGIRDFDDFENLSFRRIGAPFNLGMPDKDGDAPGDDYLAAEKDFVVEEGRPSSTAELLPLTIGEAKAGLALQFGVSPEQIEITIRG